MLFPSLLIGTLSAVIASIPPLLHAAYPTAGWTSASLFLGIIVFAVLIQHFVIERRPGYRGYDGLADLMIHIQLSGSPDSSLRWTLRGLISFLLAVFGGSAGPEGAAVEFTHALAIRTRDRSARWFEQRRRTDASAALAGGFAAAFGAPFAAVLLPVELGIGGRFLVTATTSLTAFLVSRTLALRMHLHLFEFGSVLYAFQVRELREWIVIAAIAGCAGACAALLIRFTAQLKETLRVLFPDKTWARTLIAGCLLSLLGLVHTSGHMTGTSILEQVLWAQQSPQEAGLLFCVHALAFVSVLAAFGTLGIFWPILAIGALLGFELNSLSAVMTGYSGLHWSSISPGAIGFSASAALIGGTSLWTAMLGTPLMSAVAAYEISGNIHAMIPVFAAGLVALEIRKRLAPGSLLDTELSARGMTLVQGKSRAILESLLVRDAMVSDHETVREQDAVSELHDRILKARYPFLPVVDSRGSFKGLLTVDQIQEAWKDAWKSSSTGTGDATVNGEVPRIPLSSLLEAKDILYRAGEESRSACPRAGVEDRLLVGALLTADHPCVPVLEAGGGVVGLLFAHNVRLAYDREVARRSLKLEVRSESS